MEKNILDLIKDADLVLVGIGKEFEKDRFVADDEAVKSLNQLAGILEKKNYFVISLCTNNVAKMSELQTDRVVQPCGNVKQKQCPDRCEEGLMELTDIETSNLKSQLPGENLPDLDLGLCPKCGKSLILNTVYTENYDENGYLKDWTRYTKWLQGTLNKKLCILELGVDLTYPSIIRWPFEKVAFYNNKAHFIRVNERLYHMSEEIKEKGISVAKNAVDWLMEE